MHPELPSLDTVSVNQILQIATTFNINIQLYTLTEVNKQLQATLLNNIKCEDENAQQIMLHFDIKQKHFVLINTFVGYVVYCTVLFVKKFLNIQKLLDLKSIKQNIKCLKKC